MTRPLILAVDVDDVVCDLLGPWLKAYCKHYRDTLTPDRLTSWEIENDVKPECGRRIFDFLTPSLYYIAQPIRGALRAVEEMREAGHRVVFVTASTKAGMSDAKLLWLRRWRFLPQDQSAWSDYFPVKDKSLIAADVLFDDHIDNCSAFPREAVLITRPHNAGRFTACTRIDGLHEWRTALEKMK